MIQTPYIALDRRLPPMPPVKERPNMLSLLTALLALSAALSGVLLGRCNTRCLLAKNEAILAQGRAADSWAFYQSRNIRAEVLELRTDLVQGKAARDRLNEKSNSYLGALRLFVTSLVLLQIALALSPVYLAVKRDLVLWAACAVGGAGFIALVMAAARYLTLP